MVRLMVCSMAMVMLCATALAGPPYITDDPEPTDTSHYEMYLFHNGSYSRGNLDGAYGIDFNYGAAEDVQLTAVVPVAFTAPSEGRGVQELGNIELAVKYRFLRQTDVGWDISVFPRLFLPSGSAAVGARHVTFLLPLWVGRSFGDWSVFGGGGCAYNRGDTSQNYCQMGWAVTRQLLPHLQVGAEVVHQGADQKGGRVSTQTGVGMLYDFSDTLHFAGSWGPFLQHPGVNGQYCWYGAIEFSL